MGTDSTDYPFFMATEPRSGFHFLMSLVVSSGHLNYFGERLKRLQIQAESSEITDTDILDRFHWIKSKYIRNGLWGVKVDTGTFKYAIRYLDLKGICPSDIKWIWLRRNDLIQQAVSHRRAAKIDLFWLEKSQYESKRARNQMPVELGIVTLEKEILRSYLTNTAWERFFEESGIEPYTLFYEDFIDPPTWKPVVKGVLEYLGIKNPTLGKIDTEYLKQGNIDEVRRYEKQLLERWVPGMVPERS